MTTHECLTTDASNNSNRQLSITMYIADEDPNTVADSENNHAKTMLLFSSIYTVPNRGRFISEHVSR